MILRVLLPRGDTSLQGLRQNQPGSVAFHGEFREIAPDERIVSTEVFEMPETHESEGAVNTATFTEAEGRTTLAILMQLPTREDRDMVINSGMEGGMQECMDLLEQVAISLG